MELTTHQKTVKYTVYCLVIAVAGLLQNTPGLFWQIGSARCFLLYWLCFILIKGVDGGTNTLFTFYLPCALYTAVVAPILWFLLRPLRQRLNRKALQ